MLIITVRPNTKKKIAAAKSGNEGEAWALAADEDILGHSLPYRARAVFPQSGISVYRDAISMS
jgi:hypothetical protein